MTKCAICRQEFMKRSMTHKTCGPDCAEIYGREKSRSAVEKQKRKEAKQDRINVRERKEKLKTTGQIKKDVERVVNAYIRERDKDLPCISCGTYTSYPCFHAGHFIAKGANDTIRFEPENIHKQCARCNTHGNGMYGPYRISLISKIGVERVEWLEGWHEPRHYTKDDLYGIKENFRKKLKELK